MRYSDKGKKVILFLSFMHGGVAGAWAEMVMEQILVDEDALAVNTAYVSKYRSLKAVTDTFNIRFEYADKKGEAQVVFENLKQGSRMVEQYITEFEIPAPKPKYDEEAQIYFFKKGLRPSILDDVYRIHPVATKLDMYKSYAKEVDAQTRGHELEKKRWGQSNHGARFQTFFKTQQPPDRSAQARPPPPTTSNDQAVPMDIDTVKRTPLTLDQKKQLFVTNSCFYCRKPNTGHIARDCLQKTLRPRVRALDATPDAPAASASLNPTPSLTQEAEEDPLKSLSKFIKHINTLDAERREEASALLKDLATTLDF